MIAPFSNYNYITTFSTVNLKVLIIIAFSFYIYYILVGDEK